MHVPSQFNGGRVDNDLFPVDNALYVSGFHKPACKCQMLPASVQRVYHTYHIYGPALILLAAPCTYRTNCLIQLNSWFWTPNTLLIKVEIIVNKISCALCNINICKLCTKSATFSVMINYSIASVYCQCSQLVDSGTGTAGVSVIANCAGVAKHNIL